MRLSLVIPVYNESDAIRRCLEHVAAQTRPVDECVIVDNNSSDDTMEIVREFVDRLPLTLIREERQGVAWAREAGYLAASGDVVGQIDSDSWLDDGWAAAVVEYLEEHPDVDGVTGPFYFHGAPAALSGEAGVRATEDAPATDCGGTTLGLSGGNSAVRRSAWLAARPHYLNQPGTHEDVDMSYALAAVDAVSHRLPSMIVSISTRRYEASPLSNWRYLRATIRTQRAHGDSSAARKQQWLLPVNLAQMAVAGLIFRCWDSDREAWRLFGGGRTSRISPVTD